MKDSANEMIILARRICWVGIVLTTLELVSEVIAVFEILYSKDAAHFYSQMRVLGSFHWVIDTASFVTSVFLLMGAFGFVFGRKGALRLLYLYCALEALLTLWGIGYEAWRSEIAFSSRVNVMMKLMSAHHFISRVAFPLFLFMVLRSQSLREEMRGKTQGFSVIMPSEATRLDE